jgi:hypothetical protein
MATSANPQQRIRELAEAAGKRKPCEFTPKSSGWGSSSKTTPPRSRSRPSVALAVGGQRLQRTTRRLLPGSGEPRPGDFFQCVSSVYPLASRRAQACRKPAGAAVEWQLASSSSGLEEALEELCGHLQLVRGMFAAICRRNPPPLETIELREIPRYLREMRARLQEIEQHLQAIDQT